jgi:BCCT family betaine/carnitine transporter
VREFVTCVLIIPSLVCVLWMAVFGGTAISEIGQPRTGLRAGDRRLQPLELKLFAMLEACRWPRSPRRSASSW